MFNDSNLIELFTRLGKEILNERATASSALKDLEQRKVRAAAVRRLQGIAFDRIGHSREEPPENGWSGEIQVTDIAYNLLSQGLQSHATRLLEDVAICEGGNFHPLNNIWMFLLQMQDFELSTDLSCCEHPFTFSGDDYFLRDENPYKLLPNSLLACKSTVPKEGQAPDSDLLLLDTFIEKRKRITSKPRTGPSLQDFIQGKNKITHELPCSTIAEQPSRLLAVSTPEKQIQVNSVSALDLENTVLPEKKTFLQSYEKELVEKEPILRRKSKRSPKDDSGKKFLLLAMHENSFAVRSLLGQTPPQELALREVTPEDFISQAKYLMCGIENQLFRYDDEKQKFLMEDGIYVNGLSPDCLEEISRPFIECGTYYKRMTTSSSNGLRCSDGILQPVFWECIVDFLETHRSTVMGLPIIDNLMAFRHATTGIHISMASVHKLCCRSDVDLPSGGELLTHLHNICCTVQHPPAQDAIFTILYRCSAVFISKQVEKWVFHGTVDPEFFVKIDSELSERRDRSCYHSVNFDDQGVPCFFTKLAHSIYATGRAVWILRLFDPENKFTYFLESLKYPRLELCMSESQLSKLSELFSRYQESVVHLSGQVSFMSLKEKERREEEQRIVNMKAMQQKIKEVLEKRKTVQLKIAKEKMIEKEQLLKEQLREIEENRARKKFAIQEQRRIEREEIQAFEKLESEKKALMESEEKKKAIAYYEEMSEATEKLQMEAEWQLKRIELSEKRLEILKEDLINDNTHLDEEGNVVTSTYPDLVDPVDLADVENSNIDMADAAVPPPDFESVDNIANNNTQAPPHQAREEASENKKRALGTQIGSDVTRFDPEIQAPPHQAREEASENKRKALGIQIGMEVPVFDPEIVTLTAAMQNKAKILSASAGLADFNSASCEATKNNLNSDKIEYDFNSPLPILRSPRTETDAMRNKRKILGVKYNFQDHHPTPMKQPEILTEAMRNKMKILGVEYNLNIEEQSRMPGVVTDAMKNKEKMMSVSSPVERTQTRSTAARKNKEKILGTEYNMVFGLADSEVDLKRQSSEEPITEPITEVARTDEGYQSSSEPVPPLEELDKKNKASLFKFSTFNPELLPTLIDSAKTVDAPFESIGRDMTTFARNVEKSLSIALRVQETLANNAIIHHLIVKENLMFHLNSLRSYFLHYDGEFSRNLTHGLFEALATQSKPRLFFDRSLLSGILNESLIHKRVAPENLSFQIVKMPNELNLQSHDVLTPFQLSYKVKWPLNIIITEKALTKYQRVFHVMLNLKRAHWTLNETFLLLKTQAKDNKIDGKKLMNSPEYTKLAIYRHAMTLFIINIEEHVCAIGPQEAWKTFEEQLESVEDLDELYSVHVNFVKDINRRCFLLRATQDSLSYIHELIELGLEFHYTLKASTWRLISDVHYSHPNFASLKKIFSMFCKRTDAFIRALRRKIQHSGMKVHIPLLELIILKIKVYQTEVDDTQEKMSMTTR